jgi:hypothetical protein
MLLVGVGMGVWGFMNSAHGGAYGVLGCWPFIQGAAVRLKYSLTTCMVVGFGKICLLWTNTSAE